MSLKWKEGAAARDAFPNEATYITHLVKREDVEPAF
jgi:hypothetical protein